MRCLLIVLIVILNYQAHSNLFIPLTEENFESGLVRLQQNVQVPALQEAISLYHNHRYSPRPGLVNVEDKITTFVGYFITTTEEMIEKISRDPLYGSFEAAQKKPALIIDDDLIDINHCHEILIFLQQQPEWQTLPELIKKELSCTTSDPFKSLHYFRRPSSTKDTDSCIKEWKKCITQKAQQQFEARQEEFKKLPQHVQDLLQSPQDLINATPSLLDTLNEFYATLKHIQCFAVPLSDKLWYLNDALKTMIGHYEEYQIFLAYSG
ncbi:MAG: hypothetical protein CMM87_01715 [Rickettsiales bacterium]|nr:hypothetical protein [Rickettsiales bacterium]|tara:strand:+ start:2353 stop:3150 length:798 start_codon:yes stop_codon:yes gene_type:complete